MHIPVLLDEIIELLHIQNNERFIDATLGAGGHTLEILKKGGKVLGIEADPRMLEIARKNIVDAGFNELATLVLGNFRAIEKIAKENKFDQVDGILMDLGISSFHYDSDDRGFSFKDPSLVLDMRLNSNSQGVTAADLLNSLDRSQLTDLFSSRGLAQKVMGTRARKPFRTVGDFLSVFPTKRPGKIHPATKAFMVLRIAVNSELDNLAETLPQAYGLLKQGGKLAVISFHSGEDVIVKQFYKDKVLEGKAEGGELILPSPEEIERNARARSAKLRILKKL